MNPHEQSERLVLVEPGFALAGFLPQRLLVGFVLAATLRSESP